MVQVKILSLERGIRSNAVTKSHIGTLPENTPLYKAVGKTFVYGDHNKIQNNLDISTEKFTKSLLDLKDRKEFLERRITSTNTHIQDLLT